jgi:sialate O-acetylesterase
MKYFVIIIALFSLSQALQAQFSLDPFFSDHMIWQRDEPVTVWGKGKPGAELSLHFGPQTKTIRIGADSNWKAQFNPMPLNRKPQSLSISGAGKRVVVKDILIGDVFLCFGQSNMEWPMRNSLGFAETMLQPDYPEIRWWNPSFAGKNIYGTIFTDSVLRRLQADSFYKGRWERCDAQSLPAMSAVAFYFAQDLYRSQKIPIGLIQLAIGGAPIETFVPREVLASLASFSKKLEGSWLYNSHLPEWIKERGIQNLEKLHNVPGDNTGPNHAYKPGFAFEAGIKPLFGFPIKALLFYQGESNAQEWARLEEYNELSSLMVQSYRNGWKNEKMPFYYVQLSSIDTIRYKGQLWGHFRDQQRLLMEQLPYAGMAVSSDYGDRHDVHPRNKQEPGRRLARWALRDLYGEEICASGPLPVSATYANGMVRISFQYDCGGLQSRDEESLRGFSTDGIHETDARIVDSVVEIPISNKPAYVYYGFAPFSEGNLVNAEGLPASTFKIKVE